MADNNMTVDCMEQIYLSFLVAAMPRNIKSASSLSSDATSSIGNYDARDFNVWSMIKRSTGENAFCLTSKYRTNAKIHRISDVTVRRPRRDADDVNNDVNDSDTSSSSDISQDWEHLDEEDDDLEDLYNMLSNEPDIRVAASSILAITKMMAFKRQNSAPEPVVIEETAKTGTRAQKMYLKKCDEFQASYSKNFLHSLNTPSASVAHQYVGNKGIEACVIALTQTRCVTVLNLSNNDIRYKGAKYIAMLLKDTTSITDLNVANNKICVRGATYLTQVIGDTDRLIRFDISNNCLKEKDASIFKQMLEETRNLKYLNISQNRFSEEGGIILGEALSYNDGLEELDLSWNHLRRNGSAGVAEGLLDNSSLKTLDLSWNGFYLEGCRVLEKALVHNSTLLTLNLTNNRINRECLDHLTRGLARNRTLRTLILKLNPLTSDGAYDILQFINECPTSGIEVLDLGTQQVDTGFELLLTEIKMQRRTVNVTYGQVIGRKVPLNPSLESDILKEPPALILKEYSELMGFRLVDLLTSLDRRGTRAVSKEEMWVGLKVAGLPFTDSAIKKLISRLDLNREGLVDIREVLSVEKEHADQAVTLADTQANGDKVLMNTIPIWRIRTKLRKLVLEKMTDFNKFKKVSEQLAKQIDSVIDAKNEEIEHEEELKRLKKNRSKSITGDQVPTRFSRFKQPATTLDSSKSYNINDGVALGGNMPTIAQGWTDDSAGLEADHAKSPDMDKGQNETKPKNLTNFGNIAAGIKSDRTNTGGTNTVAFDDDIAIEECDTFPDQFDDYPGDKINTVSTASKTFRRNTVGTLKLGNIREKTLKQ